MVIIQKEKKRGNHCNATLVGQNALAIARQRIIDSIGRKLKRNRKLNSETGKLANENINHTQHKITACNAKRTIGKQDLIELLETGWSQTQTGGGVSTIPLGRAPWVRPPVITALQTRQPITGTSLPG